MAAQTVERIAQAEAAVRVEIRHSERDYLDAVSVLRRRAPELLEDFRRTHRRTALYSIGVLAILPALMSVAAQTVAGPVLTILTWAVAAVIFVWLSYVLFMLFPPLDKPNVTASQIYEITEAGLRRESWGSSVTWPWPSIENIERSDGFVLIGFARAVLALPANQFPSVTAVDDFVSALRRHAPEAGAHIRCSPRAPR